MAQFSSSGASRLGADLVLVFQLILPVECLLVLFGICFPSFVVLHLPELI